MLSLAKIPNLCLTIKLIKPPVALIHATCFIQERWNTWVQSKQLSRSGLWMLLVLCVHRIMSFQQLQASNSWLSITFLAGPSIYYVFLSYMLSLKIKRLLFTYNKAVSNRVSSQALWEMTCWPHQGYVALYSEGWLLFDSSATGSLSSASCTTSVTAQEQTVGTTITAGLKRPSLEPPFTHFNIYVGNHNGLA